ncbi:FecR family protein [uncultured Psychroserpens sp.]|uniref:FecR family protein n=1 Tax=uncultured Psychroserpens sp. TaxID=255436 RepID=UPI00261AE438|nr:FecR family protein [uncultured Psychroserpens sp.]
MDKEHLVKKWLNNDLSNRESKAFNALEDADLYKEIIEEAQRFNGNANAKVESFETLDKRLGSKKSKSTNWIRVVSSLAAVLVISIALFTLVNKGQTRSFKTDLAQSEIITLPDNSIVNLNELSEIEYDSSNWSEQRSLNLNGEAFFDVEKGKRFEVYTDFGKVSVLGTAFNVFSRDSVFRVSCYEGLVQVMCNGKKVKLPAGTEFKLASGQSSTSSIVITEPYWLKNMSVFENAAFIDVINELEKHYNIKVQYPSEINANFTGAFEHENLENALKSITSPLNLTYIVQNSNQVIIRNGQH